MINQLLHFRLLLQNRLMDFMKLVEVSFYIGRDEVPMIPYMCCCFSTRSAKGWIRDGAKLGHGGPLLQETSSSDRKATTTNRMYSNDLEACGFFCSVPNSNFWRVFDALLDFVILAYFNVISIDVYAVKCVICINFYSCNFQVYKWEKAYIKELNPWRF